jgi:hypothetical protein
MHFIFLGRLRKAEEMGNSKISTMNRIQDACARYLILHMTVYADRLEDD